MALARIFRAVNRLPRGSRGLLKKALAITALALAFSSAYDESAAAAGRCEELFDRIWRSISRSSEYDEGFGARGLSYRMTGRIQDGRGESFLVAVKTDPNAPWSAGRESRNVFRGDPSWNFRNFSPAFMNRMGFALDQDRYLVPTADTLNRRVAALNRTLAPDKKIPFSYYTPKVDRVPDREYLVRFLKNRELPMAGHGDEAFHDAHYHFAAIALPPELVEHAARQLGTLTGLADFVERAHPSLLDRPISRLPGSATLRTEIDRLISAGAKDVDALTAAPTTARGNVPRPFSDYTEVRGGSAEYLRTHLEEGRSPVEYLRQKINGQPSDSTLRKVLEEYVRELAKDPANTRSMALPVERLKARLMERFADFDPLP